MFNKKGYIQKLKIPVAGLLAGVSLFTGAHRAQATMFDSNVFDVITEFFSGSASYSGAQTAGQVIKNAVKEIGKQILQNLAKQLLNKMTESTVNWINSGFEGNPQFVANPKSFFKDVGDIQVKAVVDTIGYNSDKFPFGREISRSIILGQRLKQSGIEGTLQFTLDKVAGPNWKNFQTDFSSGGWDAYEAFSQNPANNPLGAYLVASQEVEKAIQEKVGAVEKELTKGQGFLDQKVCTRYRTGHQQAGGGNSTGTGRNPQQAGGGNSTGTGRNPQQAGGGNSTSGNTQSDTPSFSENLSGVDDKDCLEYKTTSPGAVVQTQINKALSSKFTQSELGQAMGNSISNIINALTNQLMSKGLGALSDAVNGGSAEEEDTWSYDGLTLSGPVSGSLVNGGSAWASGPDKIYDLNELLITGTPIRSEVVIRKNPQTGLDEQQIVVREYGPTAIDLTKKEMLLYKEITSKLDGMGGRLAELDHCIPGPDYKWEQRYKDNVQTAKRKLEKAAGSNNEKKSNAANDALDVVAEGVEKILQKIKTLAIEKNIPGYVSMTDEVNRAAAFAFKKEEYFNKFFQKTTTVARLNSIKTRYQAINYNPTVLDPVKLKQVKELVKEYSLLESEITSEFTLGEAENILKNINTELENIAAYMDPRNPNSCPAQRADPKNQVLFYASVDNRGNMSNVRNVIGTPTGPVFSAYGTGLAFNTPETLPGELTGVTIIRDRPVETMISELKQSHSASLLTENRLRGLDPVGLMYVYSVVVGNSQTNLIPGRSGNDLITNAIELVSDIDGESQLSYTFNGEVAYYCQQAIDSVDLQNVYKKKDVDIHCNRFYTSQTTAYTVERPK